MTIKKSPCSECPFSRNSAAGDAGNGGASPEVYVGQAAGPFMLSCHQDPDYSQDTAGAQWERLNQCAGAAIYRANTGIAELLPEEAFGRLPADTGKVFATPAELLAHRAEITLAQAERFLERFSVNKLREMEFAKITPEMIHRKERKA